MSARRVSIVVADRHPVFLSGLVEILRSQSDFHLAACCRDSASCVRAIEKFEPQLGLIDFGLDGFRLLTAARAAHSATRVVFFSDYCEKPEVARAIAAGAYGMISRQRSADELIRDLRKVALGERLVPPVVAQPDHHPHSASRVGQMTALTDREREIMRLVCAGLSNKEVARQLNVSHGTIKVHLHHVYEKLAIRNRTALAALRVDDDDKGPEEETAV